MNGELQRLQVILFCLLVAIALNQAHMKLKILLEIRSRSVEQVEEAIGDSNETEKVVGKSKLRFQGPKI